jgi:pimeloyl-ACP methyl ester carboxylesterase
VVVLLLSAAVHRQHNRDHYSTGPADAALPALAKAHGYVLRTLDVAPHVRLLGILRMPSSDQAPFVLFFPGNSVRQLAASLPALEAMRAGRDAGFMAFATRGFDGSTGIPSPSALESDARAQFAYVRGMLHVQAQPLVVIGYSIGSGIALRLAAELSRAQAPPAAVVLLSPYWTLALGPASPFELLLPSEHYRVADIAADLKSPVLVVAGDQDEALPVAAHARPLVRALPAGTQYWELPGRNHVDYLQDLALLARIGNFVLTVVPRPDNLVRTYSVRRAVSSSCEAIGEKMWRIRR